MEETSENAPLKPVAEQKPKIPITTLSKTFGSRYFLISTLITSIIPLIQLVVGLYYKGQCPIDQRIPTYMIIAGIFGLVLVGLSILLAITFLCFVSGSDALTILASCGICLNALLTLFISIFVFIWFIIGCVWVFRIHSSVQFNDKTKATFCEPVLYNSAFSLLITTIVLSFLQCCFTCFRQCCTGQSGTKE